VPTIAAGILDFLIRIFSDELEGKRLYAKDENQPPCCKEV
jgi:hypothetical protein